MREKKGLDIFKGLRSIASMRKMTMLSMAFNKIHCIMFCADTRASGMGALVLYINKRSA